MPAKCLMTWEPDPRRWRKMAGGSVHVVSCRQLSHHYNQPVPETKEGSYLLANRWWRDRAAQLRLDSRTTHPHAPLIADLRWRVEDARRHAPDEVADLSRHLREVEATGEEGEPDYDPVESAAIADNLRIAALFGVQVPDSLPPEIESQLFGMRRMNQDRRKREPHADPVAVDRTVGAQVEGYLSELLDRHRAKAISVSEVANARAGLSFFRDWLGPDSPVDAIVAARWQAFYLHLLAHPMKSITTKRKHFRYARNFLAWMDAMGTHKTPPNLNSRTYRFRGGDHAVPTMPVEVVKATIAASTGQLKLHLLLMLNCGFTQQDISDIRDDEVDWEDGRITRKRSKEGDHANVPTVDYLLWQNTFALLKQYRSGNLNHVLMAESGREWVRDSIKPDGSRSRTDAIQSTYRHVCVDGKSPLKMYRKTGSTLLDGSAEHARYAVHYLGHAHTVAHKHYINANGAGFDEAIRWLGEQFGY